MPFFFAWVDPTETTFGATHHRNDADVFSFAVSHAEGEFARLTLEVQNPLVGLLSAARKRWAWLSWDDGSTVHPLFFGRVVGAPEDVGEETLRLAFIARPADFAAQKEALAETLRVLPFFDPVWLAREQRSDPDVVLQARSALWHIDRLSLLVTASDIIVGEVGPLALDHYRDALDFRYLKSPGRQVRVSAEVSWEQRASGSIDVTAKINEAFGVAGSVYPGFASSYTGEGLVRSWPEAGADLRGGWSIGPVTVERVDGSLLPRSSLTLRTSSGGWAMFPLWQIQHSTLAAYDVSRTVTERVSFVVDADIQPLITGDDEEDAVEIPLQSSAVGEAIDGALPIGDVRRRSYFQTDRGQSSLEHLIALARAQLLAQARAVEVIADIPFAQAVQLSCRHSAEVTDARLPGGAALGKVTAYSFSMNGDSGELVGSVTLACTVGRGTSLIPAAPGAGYVEDGYVVDGYQSLISGDSVLATGDLGFQYFGSVAIADDGVDLFSLTADAMVLSCTVENGQTAQAAIAGITYADAAAAAEAMNAVPTRVLLQMKPLDGRVFETDYAIVTTPLSVPKTIDLEAAA